MRTGCAASVSLLLTGCVLAAGCAGPLSKRTASFAAAGAPAITDTSAAFALVQSNHAAAVLAQRVQAYETKSLDTLRGPVTLGSAEDLKARTEIFALLTAYVSGLRTVSGGKAETPAATATAAAGQAAADTLAKDSGAIPDVHAPKLANAQLGAAASAIEKVEALLADRARRRELPRILAEADPAIEAICTTLRRDIGTPGSPGLRNQMQADYEQRIHLASAGIRDHWNSFSYPEREHAIRDLFALTDNEAAADAVLQQTGALLAEFAATHHALASTAAHGPAPAFDKQLGRLALEAKQLAAAEQTVTAAGKDLP